MQKSSIMINIFRLFTSIVIFICTLFYYSDDIENWQIAHDTYGYLGYNYFSKPWNTYRTPGISFFWESLGLKDDLKNAFKKYPREQDFNTSGRKDGKINVLGKKLVRANIILIGITFSGLGFALSTIINPFLSLIFVITSMYFGALPPPKLLLADLPACSFTVIFITLCIFYSRYKKRILLFFLCCCAVFACLIKPVMFFLSFIAGCILLYNLLLFLLEKNIKDALITLYTGVFLIVGTLLWPFLLYIESGIFVPGQLTPITKNMIAVYLVEEGDDQLFIETEHKALVADLIAHKIDADAEIDKLYYANEPRSDHSKAHIFLHSADIYGWKYIYQIYDMHGYKNLSRIKVLQLSKEISDPIIKKHMDERVKIMGRSFLSAFGAYKDMPISLWWRQGLGDHALILSIGAYIFLFCSILFGVKNLQFILLILTCLHVDSVLFTSVGLVVYDRYLQITEWSFILALEIGAYSLGRVFLSAQTRARTMKV